MENGESIRLKEVARAALRALAGGAPVAVVRLVAAAEPPAAAVRTVLVREDSLEGTLGDPETDARAAELGRRALAGRGALSEDVEGVGLLFAQPYGATERLVIAGGGHIAVELARLGASLGFRVLVMEDRDEFVDPARFAAGVETRLVDFADAFSDVPLDGDTYLVLVTRGHEHDLACLRTVLGGAARPAYIGLIGSRRRVRAAFIALRGAGAPDSALEELYAPIGLDIGAETPAEIAVAIAAELVAVRRGSLPRGSLRDRERVLERLGGAGEPEGAAGGKEP